MILIFCNKPHSPYAVKYFAMQFIKTQFFIQCFSFSIILAISIDHSEIKVQQGS